MKLPLTFGIHNQLRGCLHVSNRVRGHALVHPGILFHDAQNLQVGPVDNLNKRAFEFNLEKL